MGKKIYVLRGQPDEDYNRFRMRMLGLADTLNANFKPDTLKINLTVQKPPLISIIPFRKETVAAISITGSSAGINEFLIKTEGFTGGYAVDEAVPVAYEKTWEDKNPTPGVCLLTLFQKKPGLDYKTFIQRWHDGHTPLSLKLHPLWNYNRNVIKEILSDDSYEYDGIVEEQFKTAKDLLNPFLFFGPLFKVPRHMYMVYKDSKSFIDMKKIETYLTVEYHIKS